MTHEAASQRPLQRNLIAHQFNVTLNRMFNVSSSVSAPNPPRRHMISSGSRLQGHRISMTYF